MKCYVTELESHQVLGNYPVEPMTMFEKVLSEEQHTQFLTRPVHDTREEIIITDDIGLLDSRFEFDSAPPAPAPPGDAP